VQPKTHVQAGLNIALLLPMLRSVTILSDTLIWVPELLDSVTVRDWATTVGLGTVLCGDIGSYRLNGQYSSVKIVKSKLGKM